MLCAFLCEGWKGGRKSYLTERKREKEMCVRERELSRGGIAWVQRSGHSHKQLTETYYDN
jgi:hypothetical protein